MTVVEAVSVAQAASGRAGGFLALDWCDGQDTEGLTRRSYHLHERLAGELGGQTGYRKMNTLSLSVDSKRRAAAERTREGPSWVSGERYYLGCAKFSGFVKITKAFLILYFTGAFLSRSYFSNFLLFLGRVGSSRVLGSPATTAQVHPRLLTTALMDAAKRSGASLVLDEVTGVRLSSGAVTGLELKSGQSLEADVVVLCMGPWTGRGLGLCGLESSLISGHRAHSITIKLSDPACIDNTALFLSNMKEPELYPRPDGTVYMCGGCSADHVPLPADPGQVSVDLQACKQIKTLAGQISDQLEQAESYESSACYLPYSQDGSPIIGKSSKVITGSVSAMCDVCDMCQVRGLYIGAGHSCWGILQGPATGEALAQLVMTGHTDIDIQQLSPHRLGI